MLLNIVRTLRTTNQRKQWAHQILRSYAYKPVDRSLSNFLSKTTRRSKANRIQRKINPYDYDYDEDEKDFRRSRFFIKPKSNPPDRGFSMEIINSVPSTIDELSVQQMLNIFDELSIFRISDEALTHENFSTLIDSVKLNESSLSVRQFVEIFMNICDAEVPMYDELNEFIANILLQRCQSLTAHDIVDIDFVVRKHYRRDGRLSKLFDRLRRETRSKFLDKMDDALDKDQSFKRLMRMLKYLDNNRSLMKDYRTIRLTMLLREVFDEEFSKDDAAFVIVASARLPELNECSKELLAKAFRICRNKVKDADEVRAILKLLVEKKAARIDLKSIQDLMFIQHCTKLAIAHENITTVADILHNFNELRWTSHTLIDRISNVFNEHDETELHRVLRPIDYVTLSKACEISQYKPVNWHRKIVPAIEKAPIGGIEDHKKIDYALTLHKLGIHHEKLIEKLRKSSRIEMWYSHKPEMKEVLRIYGIDDEKLANWGTYAKWLKTDLEKFVGPRKLLTDVFVSKGVAIPIVMKIHINTGTVLEMNAATVEENLKCEPDEKIVGIPGFVWNNNLPRFKRDQILDKQEELMTRLGWLIVRLDEDSYGNRPVFKRAFVFFRKLFWAIEDAKKTK